MKTNYAENSLFIFTLIHHPHGAGVLTHILSFFPFIFPFKICVSRSKDAGPYDLGELDQALFLYLDGQDSSTNQDQRREMPLSLSRSLFQIRRRILVFCWGYFFGKQLFGSQEKHVQQIEISSN